MIVSFSRSAVSVKQPESADYAVLQMMHIIRNYTLTGAYMASPALLDCLQ